jgi:hypothetical protein
MRLDGIATRILPLYVDTMPKIVMTNLGIVSTI